MNASGSKVTKATSVDEKSRIPKCPVCAEPMERIARPVLMHALIGSKRYYCRFCRHSYLQFLGRSLPL